MTVSGGGGGVVVVGGGCDVDASDGGVIDTPAEEWNFLLKNSSVKLRCQEVLFVGSFPISSGQIRIRYMLSALAAISR